MRRNSKSFLTPGLSHSESSVETKSTIDGRDIREFTDEELVEIYLSQPHPDELGRTEVIELIREKARTAAKKKAEATERRRQSYIDHMVDMHKVIKPKSTAAELAEERIKITALSYTKNSDDFYR